MLQKNNQEGFSLILSLVVTVVSVAVVAGLVTVIDVGSEDITEYAEGVTAEQLAVLGMEDVVSDLADDVDWTDNETTITGNFGGGTYEVTLTNTLQYSTTVTSIGTYNTESYTMFREVSRADTQARDIVVDTDQVNLTDSYTRLAGVQLTNNGSSTAEIEATIVSWSYDPDDGPGNEKISDIEWDGQSVWSPPSIGTPITSQSSGEQLTWGSIGSLAAGETVSVDFQFTQSIANRVVSVVFLLSDGSQFVADYASEVDTQAEMLNVDGSGIYFDSKNKRARGIDISNLGDIDITISSLALDWEYDDPAIKIKRVFLNNRRVWSGNKTGGNTLSFNTSRSSFAPSEEKELRLVFNKDSRYRQFNMVFTMADGTTKNVSIDHRINQADYLDVDTSQASVINNELRGITLENSHSEASTAKIWAEYIQLNINPNTSQTIDGIEIDEVVVFDESDTPDSLDTWLPIDQAEVADEVPLSLIMSDMASNQTVTLSIQCRDGTIATRNFTVAEGVPMSGQLSIDGTETYVQTNRKNIYKTYVTNTGSQSITFKKMTISWDPSSNKKLRQIYIGNTRVYNNNQGVSSGTEVTLSSQKSVSGGQTAEVKLRFKQSSMTNKDITVAAELSDGSTKAITLYLNPDSGYWAAADNFEDGVNFNRGYGFESEWSSNKSVSSVIRTGNAYSGRYHAEFRGNQGVVYMERTVTNSAQVSSVTLNVATKVKNIEGSDYAILKTKIGSGNWQSTHAFTNQQNNTYELEQISLSPSIGESFDIRFEFYANAASERFYVDEVFIK